MVPILIRAIDVKKFSLKKLIDFRKREVSSPDGSQLRALRHKLLDKIEKQAKHMAALGPGLARETTQDEFEADMKDDYSDLRDALKAKATETLATKEFLTAAISGFGSIATSCAVPVFPLAAPAAAVQGVISVGGLQALKSKWVRSAESC